MRPTSRPVFSSIAGYVFKNAQFLKTALTHPSASSRDTKKEDNQRLEFLGDRVLGLVIAQELLQRHKTEDEGDIASRFNDLVRKQACAEVAKSLDLGHMLFMAPSEAKSGGRRKTTLLGDAMEAVIAAIYLDGGIEVARDFILTHWQPLFARQHEKPVDAKSTLQEWAQAHGIDIPKYEIINRQGPDHRILFTVKVTIHTTPVKTAKAQASSKRAAEQAAAKALLDILI